jgi:hypothetical protein
MRLIIHTTLARMVQPKQAVAQDGCWGLDEA